MTVANGDRIVREVKREFFAAKHGRRDAQWALKRAISQARELVYLESPQFARTARGATPPAYAWDLVAALVARMQAEPGLRIIVVLPREIAFGRQYGGWAKQGYDARLEAVHALQAVDPARVVAYHPFGFPGRSLNVRTTVAIVDDVWCLVGTSAIRRRGLTFDGATDVVSFDRRIAGGYSSGVATFRRALMALHTGVAPPRHGATPASTWVRLARPASAFELVRELLNHGGRGLIEPLWPGPPASEVLPQTDDVADPDGREVSSLLSFLVTNLANLESDAP